jgi:hypothetical protein
MRARFLKSSMKSILTLALCAGTEVCPRAQEPQKSGSDESWTKTSETANPNFSPSRTMESHTKSGNRTVDKQRLEVLGPNGRYQTSSETETETIQVNDTTTRTVVRTYRWDGNGRRTLAQVTEQESRTTASGDARVERKISSADVNGNLQVVQREIADTRKIRPDVEETKRTVYQRDNYGGFSQAEQTQELETHSADGSVAVRKTMQVPDGNGGWKVSGVTEKTIKNDGQNRMTEERISRTDIEGRLQESSRTVSKEADTPTGEKRSTVETYDGGTQLRQRVTAIQKKDSSGEITEQKIEQPNLGNPSDGTRVTGRTKYVVKYAAPGTQETKTSEIRDASGNYHVVSTETQRSTQPPPSQAQASPPAKNSDKPAPKP